MSPALATHRLARRFGGIPATDDVTFRLEHGARHALIGPNGAGKTTFLNLLTGILRPDAGRVELHGQDITALPREARVKRGLMRTFQINQLCAGLTVVEMLMLVVLERLDAGASALSRLDRHDIAIGETADILERFRLDDILDQTIRHLAYGRQRQIEIAAAFAARPRVLLLDEPAAGVPEAERRQLLESVAALPADVSVLLIEHDMDIVFRYATRITVLVNGRILAEGDPASVAANPDVKAAYLGEAAHG